MARTINILVPARREFVGLARLAVGGVARTLAFDAESVEDIKLAVSEVCTGFILSLDEDQDLNLSFKMVVLPTDLTIDISCPEAGVNMTAVASRAWGGSRADDPGISIISALLDKVELISNGDNRSVLRLKKFTELPI